MGKVLEERQGGQVLQNINSVASGQRKLKLGRLSNLRVDSAKDFGENIH